MGQTPLGEAQEEPQRIRSEAELIGDYRHLRVGDYKPPYIETYCFWSNLYDPICEGGYSINGLILWHPSMNNSYTTLADLFRSNGYRANAGEMPDYMFSEPTAADLMIPATGGETIPKRLDDWLAGFGFDPQDFYYLNAD